jgi:hypothetical protein
MEQYDKKLFFTHNHHSAARYSLWCYLSTFKHLIMNSNDKHHEQKETCCGKLNDNNQCVCKMNDNTSIHIHKKPLFNTDETWQVFERPSAPKHYDNSKGSLYEFADKHNLNSYEFDAIKRIMRCRKKGNFIEDIDKTIFLLELYKKEAPKEIKESKKYGVL